MTLSPANYNKSRIDSGDFTVDDITTLVKYWQAGHGLVADGMFGPKTEASLGLVGPPPGSLVINSDHWMHGDRVTFVVSDPSWIGGKLTGGAGPMAIVAHYSATNPGTAMNMARRRTRKFGSDPTDRLASWHITIDTDGSIVQQVALDRVAWHAGSDSAMPIKGIGPANYTAIGIELVGFGESFPAAQVAAAKDVWRAIVRRYGIKREHAMVAHSDIDPSRRRDPGPVWGAKHASDVLDAAYE